MQLRKELELHEAKWPQSSGAILCAPLPYKWCCRMLQQVQWLQVKTSRTFLRDCTVVSPMALLLFGGALSVVHESGYVLVDDWLRIRASAPTAVLVKRLRAALDALLADKVRRARPCMGSSKPTKMERAALCTLLAGISWHPAEPCEP